MTHAATNPFSVAVPIVDLEKLNGGSWHEIFTVNVTVNSTAVDVQNWLDTNT